MTAPHPSPASAADAAAREAAATAANPAAAVAETRVAPAPVVESTPPLVTFDIPLPELPTAPPEDLNQSVFASSPVP